MATMIACSSAENYKKAYTVEDNGKTFVKLRGKRNLMVHDLFSLFKNRTYEDSVLLPLNAFRNGIILGKDIPVKAGYYQFLGQVEIDDNNLYVNLYFNNTDDDTKEPYSWNGYYTIISK